MIFYSQLYFNFCRGYTDKINPSTKMFLHKGTMWKCNDQSITINE